MISDVRGGAPAATRALARLSRDHNQQTLLILRVVQFLLKTQCGSLWDGMATHGELRTRKSKSEKYMGVVRCPPKGFEQLLQVSERQTRAHFHFLLQSTVLCSEILLRRYTINYQYNYRLENDHFFSASISSHFIAIWVISIL